MMMQHNNVDGVPVGVARGERFEERMHRIRVEMLPYARDRAKDDSPWFAARVMSGREIVVKNALEIAEVEACVPMRKGPEYRRRGRIIPAKMIPVMSGYVLVRFVPCDEAFISLRAFEHIIGVLGNGTGPHPVSNAEVNKFMALAGDGRLDWERPTLVFRKGEKVRISNGPFAAFFGEVVSCRSDGKGDAVVELSLFSGITPVLMPLAILEKV